tara:strand:+ start:526 stop:813 length:288 start_codon:yes stop_codon:yes gene_type:complete
MAPTKDSKQSEVPAAATIDLAVYMERLDTYIATQSKLNETLCSRMERLDGDIDQLKEWRGKMYGAKALVILTGILFAHAAVVMASVVALIEVFRD